MASSMNIMGTYSGITMDTVEQLISAEVYKRANILKSRTVSLERCANTFDESYRQNECYNETSGV